MRMVDAGGILDQSAMRLAKMRCGNVEAERKRPVATYAANNSSVEYKEKRLNLSNERYLSKAMPRHLEPALETAQR